MLVHTRPAAAGWTWLREGLALYRKQPIGFTALVILYLFALMLLANLPFVGIALAGMLVPFATVGLAAAGRESERGRLPLPSLLVEGFLNPQTRRPLVSLGFVNAALMLVVNLAVVLLAADDIAAWKVVDGQLDPASVAENLPWDALIVGLALYAPTLMLSWFSPMLVAWQQMPVGQSLFYSFFASWRNRWPLLVLGLLLAGVIVVGAFAVSQLLHLVGASAATASVLMTPLALVLSAIAYSTLWPMYRGIFADGETPTTAIDPAG